MTHHLLATRPASERLKTEAERLRSKTLGTDGDAIYNLCLNALSLYDSDERRENVATIDFLTDRLEVALHEIDDRSDSYQNLLEKRHRASERMHALEKKVCEINSKIPSLSPEELVAFFKDSFASTLKAEQDLKTLAENLSKAPCTDVSTAQPVT